MVGRLMMVLLSLVVYAGFATGDDRNAAASPQRVALVVGNGAYENSGTILKNPANDATAIAAKLRGLGIEVIEAIDLDYKEMRDALRKFDRALRGADAGLFYYAGHAMEYRGQNYLFPTDVILETEGDVGLGLIDMNQVLQVMETAVPTRLIFLDACRNNPLARSFQRSLGASREASVGRGLARIKTAVGTFIAYATAPGDVAADGREENSPFTTAMLTHLDEPGLEISQLMQRVRNSVIESTNEKQIPWDSSSLRGPFILNLDAPINPTGASDDHVETVFWESIRDGNRPDDLKAYVERFGDDGIFTPLARSRIAALAESTFEVQEAQAAQPANADAIRDALNINVADRRRIQQALAKLGFDAGGVDGIFGPSTRDAIGRWQRSERLESTGFLRSDQHAMLLAKARNRSERPLKTGETFRDCPDCPEMVVIRGGSFSMGSPESERGRYHNEGPVHLVSVSAFAIGKYELTFNEWDVCAAESGCKHLPLRKHPLREQHPVVDVSLEDAKSYVGWLSWRTGKRYRLPSEAEWEFAARAGTKGSFPFEIPKGPLSYRNQISTGLAHFGTTWSAVVGSYPANRWGLHDMIGNVSEWVEDCWHGSYDGAPNDASAWVGTSDDGSLNDGSGWVDMKCSHQVVRGASWKKGPGNFATSNFRFAKRDWASTNTRYDDTGFRVVTGID